MKEEILLLKGKLANYKTEARNLELEASGLISMLRISLNPYEEDVSRLKVEEILNHATRLHEVIQRLRQVQTKIQQIEEDLHG